MKHFGLKGRLWLKCFHVFFACLWIGAGLGLLLMQAGLKATDGKMLYGLDISMKLIDDFLIIPGAIGSLITGLMYSLFTNWGFFKHRWVTVKWIINVGGIIFGTFWLGPWLNGLPPISNALGLDALSDSTYMHYKTMNMWLGPVQVFTLIFALFISILKPWKKTGKERK